MSTDVPFDVTAANKIALQIYDSVDPAIKSETLEEVAVAVAALDRLKREISDLLEQGKNVLARIMDDTPEATVSGIHFEKRVGAPRKSWDHAGLTVNVAQRLCDKAIDFETGEITKSPIEIAQEMMKFAGVSYWKVKELAKLGLNADNFCEVGEPKENIIITTKEA